MYQQLLSVDWAVVANRESIDGPKTQQKIRPTGSSASIPSSYEQREVILCQVGTNEYLKCTYYLIMYRSRLAILVRELVACS